MGSTDVMGQNPGWHMCASTESGWHRQASIESGIAQVSTLVVREQTRMPGARPTRLASRQTQIFKPLMPTLLLDGLKKSPQGPMYRPDIEAQPRAALQLSKAGQTDSRLDYLRKEVACYN